MKMNGVLAAGATWMIAAAATAQGLDQRLDEAEFLRGLSDLGAESVIEHFGHTRPTTDPVTTALRTLALLRADAMNDDPADPARLPKLVTLLDQRSRLIEAHPDHARRGEWLLEEMHDLVLEAWLRGGTSANVMFGLPDPAFDRLVGLMRHAASRFGAQASAAPEVEIDSVRRMRERLPALTLIATLVATELDGTMDAQARLALQSQVAEKLPVEADRLTGALALYARIYAGIALARLGRFDDAEQMLRDAVLHPDADGLVKFTGRMGAVINRQVRGGVAAGLEAIDSFEHRYTAPDQLYFALLLADQRFRLHRDRGDRADVAALSYLRLLEGGTLAPRATVAPLVIDRIVRAAPPADGEAPGGVLAAWGLSLIRHPESRARGVEYLSRALEDATLSPPMAHLARLGAAEAAAAEGDHAGAARRLVHAIEMAPKPADRDEAAQHAARLAATEGIESELAADLVAAALTSSPSHPESSWWRWRLAEIHAQNGSLVEARQLLASMPADAPAWAESRGLLLDVLWAWAESGAEESIRRDRWAASAETIGAIDRHFEGHAEIDPATRSLIAVALARLALIRGEPADALRGVDPLVRDRDALPEAVRPRALVVQMDALRDLGRFAEAAAALRELAGLAPPLADRGVPSLLRAWQNAAATDEGAKASLAQGVTAIGSCVDAFEQAPAPDTLLALAEAELALERWTQALARFNALLAEQPNAAEALIGKGEALFGLGRSSGTESVLAEALTLFKRIAAASRPADRTYWLAELRMLQILDSSGRGAEQIAPRIAALRATHPSLGGPEFADGFAALDAKYPLVR